MEASERAADKRVRVGVTSDLTGGRAPQLGSTLSRHCSLLKATGVEPIILQSDMDPLSAIEELRLTGIVFTGGGDIAPARYGGDATLARDVNQQRDDFEFLLVRETFERGLPVLAVCRGMQVVNVALGGTLITDLRSTTASENFLAHHQINDTELHYEDYAHDIAITSGSLLQEILGTQHCAVNSFHHQAIDTLSSDLHPVARSSDGVIEAVEFKKPGKGFFIGLQWHPEVIAQDPLTVRLYQYFGRTCSTAVK